MNIKALLRPHMSGSSATNYHADHQRSPCQKGTRRRRSTPRLHVLPHGGQNTERSPHDQGGLRRRPAVPAETPHHRCSQHSRTEGALRPYQRDYANARRRSKHSTMECHRHRRRLTSHLHREGCQICLLNDRKSTCPKEERDSTTTKPAAKTTTSLQIQQPPTQG
jgi:hypothetical protein